VFNYVVIEIGNSKCMGWTLGVVVVVGWGGEGELLTVCEFIFLIFQALAQISLFF
jgi:hypothetical protein